MRRGRSNEYAVMTIDRILPGLDGLIVLRDTARATLGQGLAVSAFPRYVPV
jgi:hypothetical protein